MPRRNIYKTFTPNSYYHIYNRGIEKKDIFFEESEKQRFLSLLNRYLDTSSEEVDKDGIRYKQYYKDIQLLSYCIMDNHYHLLIYLRDDVTAMPEMMKAIATAYTQFYNKKHERLGPLFESRYKAVLVNNDAQLRYISQYIHLNPSNPFEYKFSSAFEFMHPSAPKRLNCLNPHKILELFENHDYRTVLSNQLSA